MINNGPITSGQVSSDVPLSTAMRFLRELNIRIYAQRPTGQAKARFVARQLSLDMADGVTVILPDGTRTSFDPMGGNVDLNGAVRFLEELHIHVDASTPEGKAMARTVACRLALGMADDVTVILPNGTEVAVDPEGQRLASYLVDRIRPGSYFNATLAREDGRALLVKALKSLAFRGAFDALWRLGFMHAGESLPTV